MSDMEPIENVPVLGEPKRRRGWTPVEVGAWGVILLAVVLTLWQTTRKESLPASGNENAQMVTISRYVVGLHAISQKVGLSGGGMATRPTEIATTTTATNPTTAAATGSTTVASSAPAAAGPSTEAAILLQTVDRQAKVPADSIRAAIVWGAMASKGAALERLNALARRDPPLAEPLLKDIAALRAVYAGGETPEIWTYLHDRYGWFADMAAGTEKGATDPRRAAALAAAFHTVRALLGAAVVIGVGLLMGMGLLVQMIRGLVKGRLPLRFDRPVELGGTGLLPADRRAYVEGFALFVGIWMGLRFLPALPSPWSFALVPLAFLCGALWPLFRGQTWRQWRMAVGLVAPNGVIPEFFAGWKGYVAGIPVVAAGFVLTLILINVSHANPSHPITRELGGGGADSLALLYIAACVVAPFTEEILFRGMLFAHLRERYRWWASAAVVSVVFAAVHPQGWTLIPTLGAIALVLAAIREWRGSILGSMAAHGLNNALVLTLAIQLLT